MVLMIRPYSWMTRVSWFWRADAWNRGDEQRRWGVTVADGCADSEHGVPVVFEPLGVDKESQQSFSKPKADTTTPAPSPDTPNQASKPEPPSPPNTTQVSDTPTSQTQTPYEDPEIAPSRPNIPLTPVPFRLRARLCVPPRGGHQHRGGHAGGFDRGR